MLTGSLKNQYDKLLPRSKQDSIAKINLRLQDSVAKIKRQRDSINNKKVVKIDSLKSIQ